jgi:hypothetical protein
MSVTESSINKKSTTKIFKKHIALPGEHGAWVFILSPLLIGLFAGKSFSFVSILLILAALAAFLLRQPISIAVKAYSGRRSKSDIPAAMFWSGIYGLVALLALVGICLNGYGFILYLAIPGIPVFLWHLYLVSRRAERRQLGVELVASGVLALVAPAAFWVGKGEADAMGWWLFGLTWFQSAASIVYAYARLDQRTLKTKPEMRVRLIMSWRALLYTAFNLIFVSLLSAFNFLPLWLGLPYLLQFVETIDGSLLHPAVGFKPTTIGIRQLIISTLFTILFIITWA